MSKTSFAAVSYCNKNKSSANLAKLIANNTSKLKGQYYIFTHNQNVYVAAKTAANRKNERTKTSTVAMFMAKGATAAKITGYQKYGLDIYLQISCGTKSGWVYFASYTADSSTKGEPFLTAMEGNIGYIGNSLTPYTKLGLTDNDVTKSSSSWKTLTSGGTLNEDRVVGKANFTESTSSDEAKEADAVESIASAAATTNTGGTSSDGDINVTREYAVSPTPAYFYNINEHLNRYNATVEYDENGNPISSGSSTGPGVRFDNYKERVKLSGVNYKNLRNIFGAPYQFLPTTDCRYTESGGFNDNLEQAGYEFREKILSRMPLLYMTPGNTSFMGGSKENARTALIGSLNNVQLGEDQQSSLEAMLSDYSGKLYTLTPAYAEYFNYVNPMCRAGAIFLGIQNETLNDKPLSTFHWGINEGQAYVPYVEEENTSTEEGEEEESTEDGTEPTENETEETEEEKYDWTKDDVFEKAEDSLLDDIQSAMYYGNSIPFYINSEASFQDSFSNETTESSLSTTINALSDKAREIQFLLGTASSAVGEAFDKVDGTLSDIKTQINNIVEKVAGGNSIFTTIANSVKTIVSGGRMLFPQIWSNSGFTKSYSISIKLVTPSYDKFSWWLNIYVPLCHLMALVLPRSEYINSYTTPFIIKAFYKGMFNIDMGIITEMSFNRGKEGSWTKDALPTVVDVSFTIQDLYTGMGMTSIGAMFKGTTLQNIAEMDYIANLCGININEPDIFRMVILWATFNIQDRIADFLPNLELNIGTSLRNTAMNLYNSLWGL